MTQIKHILANIKQHIDECLEKRERDMEEWKKEDPDAYYDYIAMQHNNKY